MTDQLAPGRAAVMRLSVETLLLKKLVEVNVERIEPGLRILDSRFLAERASVDLVGLDASGTLALIATGLVADGEMFVGSVGAYWWCRRHPEAVQRLFPAARVSLHRPPRMLFVGPTVARSFLRSVRERGFEIVYGIRLLDLGIRGSAVVSLEVVGPRRVRALREREDAGARSAVCGSRPGQLVA